MNNTITEKDIERRLIRKVKSYGDKTYKFISPTAAGVPDRIVLLAGHVFFVEVKRPDGELSLRQVLRLIELKGTVPHKSKLIPRCAVLSTADEVDVWVEYIYNATIPKNISLLVRHEFVGCLCGERFAEQINSMLNLKEGGIYEHL
ncbi:VRR-NUC domain protein [Eubacterium saphenum ATCC 49989]|nr:VRR-NUC domain protein [Eubacterium saphenum ATCC 49989]